MAEKKTRYLVRIVANRRLRRQRFHIRIESVMGENLFHSEKYENASWARTLGQDVADRLGAELVDET